MQNISELGMGCTRCGACVQICPIKCVSLDFDFCNPIVDESKCIGCGKCVKSCHMINKPALKKMEAAYLAVSKNRVILKNSASGGAFASIAFEILKSGGVVYGCAWNEKTWLAEQIRITDIAQIPLLQGSKYVQSQTGDTFIQARKDLKDGKNVLYSGLPCQIAGLYAFLNEEYSNLITIDLVCHGSPKEDLFQKYIASYEKKYSLKVLKWNFRAHTRNKVGYFGNAKVKKGKFTYTRPILWNADCYYNAFMNGDLSKKECFSCEYAQRLRIGDLTLGDSWGIEKIFPDKRAGNISELFVNSLKGEKLIGGSTLLNLTHLDVNQICQYNGQLNTPADKPETSDAFWTNYQDGGWEKVMGAYLKSTKLKRIKAYLVYYFPSCLKKVVHRLRRR